MGKKDRRKDGEGGDKKRELPQAAPVDDDDLEPDEDDVAFVNAHRAYGAFFGDRLSVRAIAETDPGSKRRRKRVAEEDKTAEFERGGPRKPAPGKAPRRKNEATTTTPATRTPLALPVKRLDGTVVHQPTAPAPIDGDEVDLASLPAAARAALQKARASWDEDADDAPKRAKARRELADEMRRTEYGQKSSEKWWVPDSRQKPGVRRTKTVIQTVIQTVTTSGTTEGTDGTTAEPIRKPIRISFKIRRIGRRPRDGGATRAPPRPRLPRRRCPPRTAFCP